MTQKTINRICAVLMGISFLFALGIVGAVENGASLALMWWIVPAAAVLCVCNHFFDL